MISFDINLKKYQQNLEENKIDNTLLLYQHAENLYKSGINKFPYCTPLRISYAYFLMDRMQKKQSASLEFSNAEKYNLGFEEEFIIFRFKKLIEENASSDESELEENMDVVSNIAYKNHFTQCNE